MNTILEKNRNSISDEKTYIKEYYEKKEGVQQADLKTTDSLTLGVENIADRDVLYAIQDERQYQLDSLYESDTLLEDWYNQFENVNYRSRFLLFGLGNGMYVKKVLERAGEQAAIIVVEPSMEVFDTVMAHFDLSEIMSSKKVILIVKGINDEHFLEYLREILQYEDLAGAVCRSYLNYPKLFEEDFDTFHDTIKRYTNMLEANHTVMIRFGESYFENSVLNYPYFIKQKSVVALSSRLPKGIPAILVAAGPSLDKNIKQLKAAKNKAFIIAVDSAARALVKNDIIPDAVMLVDANKSFRHFEDERVQRIPLITNLFAAKKPIHMHTGDKYFMADGNTYIKEIFDRFDKMLPQVAGGGSVSTDAFALLERMKFETVILVGLDLAYTDNKTHTKDSVRGERKITVQAPLKVEDIYGNMIGTSYEFQIYFDWFAEELKNKNIETVIDATEGGAKLPETQIMTLAEAIKKYCVKEVNMDEIMHSIPYRLSRKEQKELYEHMQQIPEKMQELSKRVSSVIEIYRKMLRMLQSNNFKKQKLLSMMEKAKRIGEEVEATPVFFYAQNAMQQAIADEMNEDLFAIREGESEAETSIKQAITYFTIMKKELNRSMEKSTEWLKEAEDNRR